MLPCDGSRFQLPSVICVISYQGLTPIPCWTEQGTAGAGPGLVLRGGRTDLHMVNPLSTTKVVRFLSYRILATSLLNIGRKKGLGAAMCAEGIAQEHARERSAKCASL